MFDGLLRFFLYHGIKNKDRVFFVHHLSLVLGAGITLPKGLLILAKQIKNKRFKKVIQNIEKEIQKGNTFEQSLQKYPWAFSPSFISMVKIGEMRGDLQTVLDGYYQLLKKQDKIRSKVRSAMVYPAAVMIALILVSIFAVTFIFPQLIELIDEFEGELPLVTRIAISISDLLTNFGIEILILLAILFVGMMVFAGTAMGKWIFHYIAIQFPVIGSIIRNYNLTVMSRNVGSLLRAGIPLTDAIETTASTMKNVYYKRSMMKAKRAVAMGESIPSALEDYPYLYPDIVLQIITVGEQSGSVDEMFIEIADFYEEKLLGTLDTLASIIEPVIIVVLGGAVVFLALSILTPLYTLSTSF